MKTNCFSLLAIALVFVAQTSFGDILFCDLQNLNNLGLNNLVDAGPKGLLPASWIYLFEGERTIDLITKRVEIRHVNHDQIHVVYEAKSQNRGRIYSVHVDLRRTRVPISIRG